MEHHLTLVCNIQPSADEATHIDATMQAFADACAFIHTAFPPNITNVMRMQALLYYEVRARFHLSSNLAQQAFRRVAANRKAARATGETVKDFAPTSIQYDQRIFAFRERDWTVSLTLLHGRVRFPLRLGTYQRGKLTGQHPTSAQVCKRRDGSYVVNIQVEIPLPSATTPTDVLGVDLGRIDIAHTSDDQDWSGHDLTALRDRYSRLRAGLQKKASKGTRSTRRRCRELLARLSGREHRFQRHTNHGIAKTLVSTACLSGRAIALEDLTGIRQRTNQERRKTTERRRSNSWAFDQLRQFVTYKAALAGVVVHLVPAAYTSQMCHACLHLGERHGKRFACRNPACLWHGDADLNGAQNIKILGLQVSQPRGPWIHSVWRAPESPWLEPWDAYTSLKLSSPYDDCPFLRHCCSAMLEPLKGCLAVPARLKWPTSPLEAGASAIPLSARRLRRLGDTVPLWRAMPKRCEPFCWPVPPRLGFSLVAPESPGANDSSNLSCARRPVRPPKRHG